jgi:hypothetical protein
MGSERLHRGKPSANEKKVRWRGVKESNEVGTEFANAAEPCDRRGPMMRSRRVN